MLEPWRRGRFGLPEPNLGLLAARESGVFDSTRRTQMAGKGCEG